MYNYNPSPKNYILINEMKVCQTHPIPSHHPFLTEQSDCRWKNATDYLLISRQHLTKTQKDP